MPRHASTLANHPDIKEVLPRFLGRLRTHVHDLRLHHAAGDTEKLRILAHQLRGAGTSFGFPGLTALSGILEEEILASSPPHQIAASLASLVDYVEHIEGY